MGITNFPNGVSSFGIPLIGSGPILTTGTVRFVHAGTGGTNNDGQDPDRPLTTIDAAINLSTATSTTYAGQDYIVVLPGHAETISAGDGYDADVAGITILGLGRASLRPTLTYSATGSTGVIGAAGVSVINLLHVASVDAVVVMMPIGTSAGALVEANEFRDAGSIGIVDTMTIGAASDVTIRNNRWAETDAGIGQSCILGTTPTRLTLDGNHMDKDAQTGCIELGIALQLQIVNNFIETSAPEDLCIVVATTATGWIDNNKLRVADDAANLTEAITIDNDCQLGRNWIVNANAQRVLEHNAVQSTDA